jgi:hypothetical protein
VEDVDEIPPVGERSGGVAGRVQGACDEVTDQGAVVDDGGEDRKHRTGDRRRSTPRGYL